MVSRQEQRSEETKRSILSAAGALFAKKGYDAVTMREIAKEARCSHTTIYIYFRDKEALLHELSMPPLTELKQSMEETLVHAARSPIQRLKAISQQFIRFCLRHRNMEAIFFKVKAVRVDEAEPTLAINNLRNDLFALMKRALQECLPPSADDTSLLTCSRIYFYTLHGIVGTYMHSEEPLEPLMERLETTFEEAVEVLLVGFQHRLKER